ncbi:hypothetical protein HY418_02625 [Candidatus Kaiserbacteria bacterium]|nr:hypothetical protein [Candidatus Kaiserbacteria bacterium]
MSNTTPEGIQGGTSMRVTLDANEFVLLEQWPIAVAQAPEGGSNVSQTASIFEPAQTFFPDILGGLMRLLQLLFGF